MELHFYHFFYPSYSDTIKALDNFNWNSVCIWCHLRWHGHIFDRNLQIKYFYPIHSWNRHCFRHKTDNEMPKSMHFWNKNWHNFCNNGAFTGYIWQTNDKLTNTRSIRNKTMCHRRHSMEKFEQDIDRFSDAIYFINEFLAFSQAFSWCDFLSNIFNLILRLNILFH